MTKPKPTSSTTIPALIEPADLPPAPPEADPVVAREHAEAVAAATRAEQSLDAAHGAVELQREAVAAAEREEREHKAEVDAAQAAVDRAAQALDEARSALFDADAERNRLAAVAAAAGLSDEEANTALLQATHKVDSARAAIQIAEAEAKRAADRLREATGEGSGHRGQWPVPSSDTPTKLEAEKTKLERLRANFERATSAKERADAALAAIEEARERRRKAYADRFQIRCSSCRYWIQSGSPSRAGSGECHANPPTDGWPVVDCSNACGRAEAIA